MSGHDRPANRQSHPHAAGLGGPERIEHGVELALGNARAVVDYAYPDAVSTRLRVDRNSAIAGRLCHRVRRIHHEVQDDLLKLHRIAIDGPETRRKLRARIDMADDELRAKQVERLGDELVDVDRLRL